LKVGLIAILLFFILSVGGLFDYPEAKSSLNLTSHTNPDSVNTGQTITLSVAILNEGNSPVQINSISLVSPEWESKTYYGKYYNEILKPNRTNTIKIQAKPDIETLSGKYFLEVLVNTTGTDYLSGSEVTVIGFDSIPLSGNVPLFIFIILIMFKLVSYQSHSDY
jgi:hypothetical protein